MLLFVIRDGWGVSSTKEGNAIAAANPAYYAKLLESCPRTEVEPCGEAVGLPAGQMGNSEVGHLNIGAGRIVYQDLLKITLEQESGEFEKRPNVDAFLKSAKNSKKVHLMGLMSDGGVHSHMDHISTFVEICKKHGIENLYLHAFMDGRDTPPQSGKSYLLDMESRMEKIGLGKFATVSGRYYAMDRDKRWDRVEKAYRCLIHGEGNKAESVKECMDNSYGDNVTDEFVLPTVIDSNGLIEAGDSVFFMNFRPDRAREITMALENVNFSDFAVKDLDLNILTMTPYSTEIKAPVAYSKDNLKNTLSEVLSNAGLKQLKIAETEKYAHVTYFLNGGREEPFNGEDRILVPSPKVATYDLQPEMSAPEVTEKLLAAIQSKKYDVLIVNYANPDMVGHTGIFDAAVEAVKVVDDCVKQVVECVLDHDGAAMLTADHGNLDVMKDKDGTPYTAHSLNPVDFIFVPKRDAKEVPGLRDGGILADLTPTILDYLGIDTAEEMTGKTLFKK
jgi:2,3-bisphosphoglycerate-independent phosphoglycerate mutase